MLSIGWSFTRVKGSIIKPATAPEQNQFCLFYGGITGVDFLKNAQNIFITFLTMDHAVTITAPI
jgi:hypothetical protein